MEISIIFKIALVGILVTILNQILKQSAGALLQCGDEPYSGQNPGLAGSTTGTWLFVSGIQ